MMSHAQQVNVLNTELRLPELLMAAGTAERMGPAAAMRCCVSTGMVNAGWMSDRTRQVGAFEPEDQPAAIIEEAALSAPFAGLEIWLSLAVLAFSVIGAVVAFLMWGSGPGFLVLFILLLFASAPLYLKGLDFLAGIDRNRDGDGET